MAETQSNHLQLLVNLHRLSQYLLKLLHLGWHFVYTQRAAGQYKRIVIHQLFHLRKLSSQYLERLPLISWIIENPSKKPIQMYLSLQPVLVERGGAEIDDADLPLRQHNSFLFSALQQIYCFHEGCFLLQTEGVGFYVEQIRGFQDFEGIVIQSSYEDDFVVDLGQLAGEEQRGEVITPRLEEVLVPLRLMFRLRGLLLDQWDEARRQQLLDGVHKLREGEDE